MFGNRKKAVDGVAKLSGVSFFEGFSPDELQRVAELADDVDAEPGAVLDDSARVDAQTHSRTSIADTSASQTSAPSTFASPRNHHMLRRLAMRVMQNRIWSPGTTGFLNFALSMVIR